jgi:peptide subunit release factor 1 (eRF1)
LFCDSENTYGVVIVRGEDAEFYSVDDKLRHRLLGKTHHSIANRQDRGGQSQARIARIREEQIHHYISKVEEGCAKYYTTNGVTTIKQVIISGPAFKKEQVRDRLDWIKCPVTLLSHSEFKDVIDKFDDIIHMDSKKDAEKQVDIIKEFIRTDSDRLVFGERDTEEEYKLGSLEKIWCSDKEKWPKVGKTDVIQVKNTFLDSFNGVIGLRWIKEVEDISFESEETSLGDTFEEESLFSD